MILPAGACARPAKKKHKTDGNAGSGRTWRHEGPMKRLRRAQGAEASDMDRRAGVLPFFPRGGEDDDTSTRND